MVFNTMDRCVIIKKSSRIERVLIKEQKNNTLPVDWRDLVTNDGVFAVDSQQNIVYWSDSAQHILGYGPENVVGKLCYDLVAGRDSQNYRFCRRNCPVMENARRGRATEDYDILCLLPTGEEKWINISVAVLKRKRSDFQVLHLFRDVTRRRRTEEFAHKAGTALRDLLDEEKSATHEGVEPASLPLPRLSRRELEVLRLLASGMSTRQIAVSLGVQPVTARNHITRVITKLGVNNRLQAVLYASERRII